jgi:hypothetical protein
MSNDWSRQATNWSEVIQRYTVYLQTPRWRGKALQADGSDAPDYYSPKQTVRIQARLLKVMEAMIAAGLLPSVVNAADIRQVAKHIGYSGRRFDRGP